jgi:hypothetical protein
MAVTVAVGVVGAVGVVVANSWKGDRRAGDDACVVAMETLRAPPLKGLTWTETPTPPNNFINL